MREGWLSEIQTVGLFQATADASSNQYLVHPRADVHHTDVLVPPSTLACNMLLEAYLYCIWYVGYIPYNNRYIRLPTPDAPTCQQRGHTPHAICPCGTIRMLHAVDP